MPAGACAGKAGQSHAFLTLKALLAGHLWLFTLCSLPGCCVPVPAGSALHPFLFSPPSAIANSPERLPPRRRVSAHCRKQEGEKPKPNLQQHREGQDPACAWSPSWRCLASAVGCFGAPLGVSGFWGLLVPGWGRGGRGMQGCACSGILFPCMAGAAGNTVQANPTVSNDKAAPNPPSHLRSKERAGICFGI